MIALFFVLAMGPTSGLAAGDALVAETAVITVTDEGTPVVLLRYDTAGLTGHYIHNAVLEWVLPIMPVDRATEYAAYAVESRWTGALTDRDPLPVLGTKPLAVWDFTPKDRLRAGRSVIRLQVTGAVQGWSNGDTNYGIAVVSRDFDRAAVKTLLSEAKLYVWNEILD